MPEHEVGQVGVFLGHDVHEALLVFHHGVGAGVAPVAPGAVRDGGGPVAHVVVGSHDEAGVHERHDHVEVAARMLAEAVDELHDALGLARRHVDPAGDLVAFVARGEGDFVEHGLSLSCRGVLPRAFVDRAFGCEEGLGMAGLLFLRARSSRARCHYGRLVLLRAGLRMFW